MRNSIRENISEHSLEVAVLAHGLAIIANEKCGQELGSGNQEFKTACETTKEALHKMQMKEVEIFIEEFLPAYDQTLDELQAR